MPYSHPVLLLFLPPSTSFSCVHLQQASIKKTPLGWRGEPNKKSGEGVRGFRGFSGYSISMELPEGIGNAINVVMR